MHVNGIQVKYHKFEYSGNEETVAVSGHFGCQMRVLLIGGGGKRDYDGYTGNTLVGQGAGSGYINNRIIAFPNEDFVVNIRVGGSGEASTIQIDNDRTISAQPGGDSASPKGVTAFGGNGFSGGECILPVGKEQPGAMFC